MVPGKGSQRPPHDIASMQQSRFQRQRGFLRCRCPRSMIRSCSRRHKSIPASVDLPRRAHDDHLRCRGDFHSHVYRYRSHVRAHVSGELSPVPRYSDKGSLPRHLCSGSTSLRQRSRGSIRTYGRDNWAYIVAGYASGHPLSLTPQTLWAEPLKSEPLNWESQWCWSSLRRPLFISR